METMSTMTLDQNKRNRINPQKFALWVGMASIIMMFTGWTSAYIVKQAAGNWLEFSLPNTFFISTAVLILSSIFLHLSYAGYKKQNEKQYKGLLIGAFILGIAFVVLQYLGWTSLFNQGVDFKGNVAGSFTYLVTGAHALHVVGGIAALTVAMIHAFTLKFKYSEKRKNRFELVVHYWHFVDVLWVYLLIFLMTTK